jgi:hypothetical protein
LTSPVAERAPGAAGGGPAAPSPDGAAEPVTLVLSLEARAGHERAFEEVPHRLDVTVLPEPPVLGTVSASGNRPPTIFPGRLRS